MNDFLTALMSTGMIALLTMVGWFFKRFFTKLDELFDKVDRLISDVTTLKVRVHFLENKQGIVAREETKDGNGD